MTTAVQTRLLPIEDVQALSRRVLSSRDPIEVSALLTAILDQYNVLNFTFTYDRCLWRACKCDDEKGFPLIARMLGPPARLATAGRLNEPGSPLVYASINQFAALHEIGARPGDFVQLVALNLVPNKPMRCAVVGERMNVHRSGRAWLSDSIGTALNRLMNEMVPEVGRSYVFTDAFLAHLLSDTKASSNDYLFSRTAARLIFEKQKNVDAIVYPSVSLGNSMNFALKTNVLDVSVQVGWTFVVEVLKEFDYGIFDTRIVRRARGHWVDGSIDWNDALPGG